MRATLRRALQRHGYRVCAAADPRRALQVVKRARPDLVMLDLKLRAENAWDLFGRLTHKWPSLPVVVISPTPNQLFTALAAGVGALLETPLQMPRMLQAVSHLLCETVEDRLERVAGKLAQFHYQPASPQPSI